MNRTETGYKLPGERAHTARMLLEEEVASRYGEILPHQQAILDAYEQTEALRLRAVDDVATNGLRESYTSGRQRVVRKNVAYEQALRAAASLTKLIAALKLDTKKAAPDEAGNGEDEDDDLDDY